MRTILTTIACLGGAAALIAAFAIADQLDETKKLDKPKSLTLAVYALDTCPVSDMKLGTMGDPVVKKYDGREVRFCCEGCVEPFEADKAKFFQKIDAQLIEQQKAHYALEECIVSGRSLAEIEEPVDRIHDGRLVRFCCPGCPPRLAANPDRYMTKLDEAVIKQQRERYPLKTCVVAGMELGSMGEPDEIIVGGSLVRFCCAGCRPQFHKEPAKYLAQLRDAWRKQHAPKPGEGH
jgi:YHS domain-containing protein